MWTKKFEDTLSKESLEPLLTTSTFGKALHYYKKVDSTQTYAHEWAKFHAPEGGVVIAEEQVQGRGRLGRQWVSPANTGIWISLILRPNIPLLYAPELTLLASVAIVQAIRKETKLPVGIKWPNDILLNGKKVCGILTEARATKQKVDYVVSGIGINVNMKEKDFPPFLENEATSLSIGGKQYFRRAPLLASVLKEMEYLYGCYLENGFSAIHPLWEKYAVILGETIETLNSEGKMIRGIAKGLDERGALLIEVGQECVPIYSADIAIPSFERVVRYCVEE